jgi:hypothetical protein
VRDANARQVMNRRTDLHMDDIIHLHLRHYIPKMDSHIRL